MPPELIIDEEEDYASSEDSDFAPDDAPEQEGDVDSSGDEDQEEGAETKTATTDSTTRKKRKHDGQEEQQDAEGDAGFENSGDEAIIEKGKKKKNKKRRKGGEGADDEDEEAGGEGGLIKTRSMRAVEKAERKVQAATGPVTVDVEALWASMTAAPIIPSTREPQQPDESQVAGTEAEGQGSAPQDGAAKDTAPDEMIKIKRTYNFAGKVHTEEKLVARDSAEARLYLASKKGADPSADGEDQDGDAPDDQADKRMPRKAFRSAFEPVLLTDSQQRTDLNLGIAVRLQAREKAKKLTTVEKSRMDWAGFVDKEGIKDELALAGRAKGSYAERQDFLARTEARREDDARRLRLAGKA